MNFDTKQKSNKKKQVKKVQSKFVAHEGIVCDNSNYCSCLERVIDYSKIKNLIVTFIEIKKEELPDVLYDTQGLEWQVWRKDYGEILKYYWYNNFLDKKVRVLDNETEPVPHGFIRLYRGVAENSLPKKVVHKKVNPFVKKKELLQNEIA